MRMVCRNNLLEYINNFETICFDCFDTVIHRKYGEMYAFTKMADFLLSEFHVVNDIHMLASSLKMFFSLVSSDYLAIKNIYYHYTIYPYISLNDFYELFISNFAFFEHNNTYISQFFINTIKGITSAKKKVILISDYYLGKKFICKLLELHNVSHLFNDIIISCEYGKTKQNKGELYDVVKASNGIMIGDSYYSDCLMSEPKGFSYYLYKNNEYKKSEKNSKTQQQTIEKKLKMIIGKDKYSFSTNIVFPLFEYCKKLYSVISEGDCVYFLAREGQFLKILFDRYLVSIANRKQIKTKYLLISRFFIDMLSCDFISLAPDELKDFFREHLGTDRINTFDFLHYIGLDSTFINNLLTNNNYNDGCFFYLNDRFNMLWGNNILKNQISRLLDNSKKLLLDELDIKKRNGIIITDVGWGGTMQYKLHNFLGPDVPIAGYYLGTRQTINEDEKSTITGLVYDVSYYRSQKEPFVFSYEPLLRANHGYFLTYDIYGKEIYYNDTSLELFNKYSKEQQVIMIEKFNKLLNINSDYPVSYPLLEKVYFTAGKKKPRYSYYLDNYNFNFQCLPRITEYKPFDYKSWLINSCISTLKRL